MGGLISLYAALEYPDVFSKAGVFSPALWVAPALVDYARERARPLATRVSRPKLYFVSAESEARSDEQVVVSEPLMAALAAAGYQIGKDLVVLNKADGAHSEWFWRREFPAAYEWLFKSSASAN